MPRLTCAVCASLGRRGWKVRPRLRMINLYELFPEGLEHLEKSVAEG